VAISSMGAGFTNFSISPHPVDPNKDLNEQNKTNKTKNADLGACMGGEPLV